MALFVPRAFTPEDGSVRSRSHLPATPLLDGRREAFPSPGREGDACAARACVRGGSVAWILLRGAQGAAVPQRQPRSSQLAERRHSLAPSPGGAGSLYLAGILCRICPRAIQAPKLQIRRQRAPLASAFFPYHLWANSIPESASGGEPEGIFFLLTLLPVPSHNLLCLKQLKELKMPPISLVPSPDGLAGPVHVMAGGALSRPVLRANPGPSRGVGHGVAEHMPGEGKGGWADLNPPLPVCAWLVWRFKASFTGLSAGSFSRVSCYARRSEAAE